MRLMLAMEHKSEGSQRRGEHYEYLPVPTLAPGG